MKSTAMILAAAMVAAGCGTTSAYKRAYVTASVAQSVVTEAQEEYDERANARLEACDPEDPDSGVTTRSELDECLGEFRLEVQDGIVKALASYRLAAIAMSAAMKGCDPSVRSDGESATRCISRSFTAAEYREYQTAVVKSAMDLLALFPGAGDKLKKLKRMIPLGGL